MRIHHLSCGSFCPFGKKLLQGTGGLLEPADVCCHCLLIESEEGLMLVDTGLSAGDLDPKLSRIPLELRAVMRPALNPAASALHQVQALGFSARDVRHIVVTHLDFDHAGGLVDFPQAQVHVFRDEYDAALRRSTLLEKRRYLQHCWSHAPNWTTHAVAGDSWKGFSAVRALSARETDVLLVPLQGHSRGHAAVAVRDTEGWLLHCGDAYFFHAEVLEPPHCPVGYSVFQRFMAFDDALRRKNQARLRALNASATDVRLFCAHDPVELARFQGSSAAPGIAAQ